MEQNNSISWARKRQIIVVIIVAVFITLVIGSIDYAFFRKQPSCFDGKQNQDETGIDCGGKCSLICSGLAKDPVVEYARLFKGIRNGYSAVAHIENQNDLIAKKAHYSFKLYDENHALITERQGEAFIPQRKSFPIFEPNIDTEGKEPTTVLFSFDNILWEKSEYEEPKLIVEDEKLSGEKISPRLTANIINPGVIEVNNVGLTSVLYDDAGNAINSSKTIIDKILPNQKIPIVFTWPYPFPESIHACAQPVDVALIIDRSGSMEFLSKNPPQPLTDVKNAANYFVKQLNDKNQASVISFANEATNESFLALDLNKVVSVIDGISIHDRAVAEQNTNIASGLQAAYAEMTSARHNLDSIKVIVMLTDGVANLPTKNGDKNYPENTAMSIANTIKSNNISLFTIGLGKDVKKDFLTSMASLPEDAFFAPTTAELTSIYQKIGIKICKVGTSRIEISPLVPLEE